MAKGRALTLVWAAVTLIAAGAAGWATWSMIREREIRVATQQELAVVKAEKDTAERKLDDTQRAKQRVEQELSVSREELQRLQQELAQERQTRETLAQSVEERQREIDRLTKDVEQFRGEREEMASQAAKLKSQQDALQAQLAEAERAKEDLESKVLELSQEPLVELDRVVVTYPGAGEPGAASVSMTNGQVIVVNREYDFIVMNMGKNQGLSIGQEFQIMRGDQVLGRVKVEKVYDELSAAAILPPSKKDAIREGDLVKPI